MEHTLFFLNTRKRILTDEEEELVNIAIHIRRTGMEWIGLMSQNRYLNYIYARYAFLISFLKITRGDQFLDIKKRLSLMFAESLAELIRDHSGRTLDFLDKDNKGTEAGKKSPEEGDNKFPLCGWNIWGDIKIKECPNEEAVVFSGRFGSAGYVIEHFADYGGKTVTFTISGSANCSLDQRKLFKFQVNDKALKPVEAKRNNMNDPYYVSTGDGIVSFRLPGEVRKLEFIFWNADFKNLKLSGILT